ncbi:universal stress protein [Lacisediminihabitans sp.]|jgi:nucleotide-binding universal stress UspA family protein|uniref:universal stress protein n=1 Tax=Lacisediminihabitans sp. TaxID=2787631 RepID=UPI002F951815
MTTQSRSVVVGIVPGQSDDVVLQAAMFASRFEAQLVCAFVETSRYVVEELADGSVRSLPFDPDLPELRDEVFDPELAAHLGSLLAARNVRWSTRALAGDPARALAHLADAVDAAMIVVGTRRTSPRRGIREFFGGSVAAQLAHRQHRPVVVIPQAPVSIEEPLPWEPA